MIKRVIILLLFSLLVWQTVPPPLPLQAAIALTATFTREESHSNPVTWNFDCNGGNLLIIGLGISDNARAGGVPTYDGVNMVDSGQGSVDSTGESIVELWYLVNPAVGENEISIPNTGAEDILLIISAWSGVDTADPLDVSDSDFNAASANPSVNITTAAANELIIDILMDADNNVPTANSHTLISSVDKGGYSTNAQYTLDDGSAGITLDWTVPLDNWAMIVCAFNPENGEPPPTRRVFIID